MDESVFPAAMTFHGRLVDELDIVFPQAGHHGVDVLDLQTHVVDAGSALLQEAGHAGELHFIGPNIFSGYYRAPALTARAFDEKGYYKTGDLFELGGDRLQYYRYAGRSKDLVIRGGMNISA